MKYKNKNIKDVTLEMSLKPFKKTDKKYIEQVITEMFRQWDALTRYADQISILLWTSDGSQILDYTGNMNEEMEWARYIGGANPRRKIPGDPEGIGLHSRFHNYIDNPPVITYKTLRSIIECLKKTGKKITGKPIRVGETFDPGPEFAKSSFKYERHNEVCRGGTMGDKSFICCYADLNGDNRRYAGFPNGIPDKTPFGVFLGRQCAHYLKDLGFDYIWFSNGFGFGVETWGATGSVFNGETFDVLAIEESKDKMLIFWRAFFKECPGLAVETRGTNLSTGMDLSSDAAPVKQIYEQFDITPPPNSPWAALNGDFGLELIGYMSHIAELPGKDYRFRFYIHDPWWNNSPWLDRYMRKAHDIYLPLSVGRINENSVIENPSLINILTVDDSFGNMPVECPNETIPHILRGYEEFPDVPGPFVWVYPFDEYHDLTFSKPERISEVFFGDWFIRDAVNNGLPLNTVASGRIFKTTMENNPAFYQDRIIVTIVPEAESSLEASIFTFLGQGGKVLLYGPLTHASQRLLDLLGMEISTPLSGTMEIEHKITEDIVESGVYPRQIEHNSVISGGGIDTVQASGKNTAIAFVRQNSNVRTVAAFTQSQSASIAWVRGINSMLHQKGSHILAKLDAKLFFQGDALMRRMLDCFGYDIRFRKTYAEQNNPVCTVTRCKNAFNFSFYAPDTTVMCSMRFPQGVPVFLESEMLIEKNEAWISIDRADRKECRIFIEQEEKSLITCRELTKRVLGVNRVFIIKGLKNAVLRCYPEDTGRITIRNNSPHPYLLNAIPFEKQNLSGLCVCVKKVSGEIVAEW